VPTLLTNLYPSIRTLLLGALTALVITGCGGSGVNGGKTSPTPDPVPTTTPTPTPLDQTLKVSKVVLSTSLATVKSDNSNSADITATLLDSGNVIVVGAKAEFTSDTGVIVLSDSVSNAEGKIVGKFSSGSIDATNRTAKVSVASNGITAIIPILISGLTVVPTPVPSPTTTVAKVVLSTSLSTVKSDNSNQADITATLLDTNNVIVAGANASLSSDTGVLVLANAVSDANGKVTGKFSSGTTDSTNRTATITATSNGISSRIPILISGLTVVPTPVPSPTTTVAKVVLSTTLSTIKSDNTNQADITATLLDANNVIVVGANTSFTADTGVLVLANSVSDATGQVTGKFSSGTTNTANRTAIITVTSNGVSSVIPITISASSATDPTTKVVRVVLSSSLAAVKSDDSNQSDVTATLLDAGNAIVVGAKATFSSSTGVMVVANPISDTKGQIVGKFSSGTADATSRTATITVISNNFSQQIPVRITGSTIDIVLVGTATLLNDGTKTANLEITPRNAGGSSIANTPVTVSSVAVAGGVLTFSPASGNTDANGKFVTTASGVTAGTVNASVSALGETRTQAFTVTQATATSSFTIASVGGAPLPADRVVPLTIGVATTVTINAPSPTTNVVFASSLGAWDGGSSSVVTKAPVNGIVSATLLSPNAGVANIQVYDKDRPSVTESFTAAVTAPSTNAFSITLQAAPNVVPRSTGGVVGTSSIIATVKDSAGNPVGGAPVSFEIIKSTGGGESINPVVQLTASVPSPEISLGQAKITFTSGSLPSGQGGVQIRAKVVGTTVSTGVGGDASITIGGTAGSIAFGQATVIKENSNLTAYVLPMSVLVADSNGNAVANTKVNLSVWPYAWSVNNLTPSNIINGVETGLNVIGCEAGGTFLNEDKNENLILDIGEDGVRDQIDRDTFAPIGLLISGTKDGKITSVNSSAGAVPVSVTTDANGVAVFDYTYTKSSAIWIVTRMRASTIVQGTETVSEIKFRLNPLEADVKPICRLTDSPYIF
jgi:hypothetical protein